MPRSVFLLDWVVMIFFSGGIRFAARALRESRLARARLDDGRRTIIIGAGEGGEQLLRQVLHDPRAGMNVVGFVDDKPETHGRTLHGVPVLGHTGRLKELAAKYDVELLVIAMRSVTGARTRRIVDRCRETGVEFKIIPSIDDLLKKRATIDQLRDVAIEDLLGRDPVHLNLEQIKQDLAGKSILVTGGAGSIGSELARQIASYGPARLVLLERAESALYFTHLEVAKANPGVEVVPFIGSITYPDRLEEMFRLYQPNYVFHAAAYKHVPMLESNATEAVWNNVFGTLRVAECAALHGVEKFVLISTDKAVNPTSVLGATKRIGERIVLELPSLCEAATDFRAVRFGNRSRPRTATATPARCARRCASWPRARWWGSPVCPSRSARTSPRRGGRRTRRRAACQTRCSTRPRSRCSRASARACRPRHGTRSSAGTAGTSPPTGRGW